MMDCKFLRDGRKVAIVGKINSTEYIVQEIFVTDDGDEIPSGEKFTSKDLHEKPLISYKEKEARRIEDNIAEAKANLAKIRHEESNAFAHLEGVKAILKSSKKLAETIDEQDLDLFVDFITGTAQWCVVDSYEIQPPAKLIDEVLQIERRYDKYSLESLKLLSVLGNSDGNLSYRIHQYNDGSGSSTEVFVFSTYEEGLEHIKQKQQENISKGYLSIDNYKKCQDIGITFDPEFVQMFKNKQASDLNERLSKVESNHNKNKESLEGQIKFVKGLV